MKELAEAFHAARHLRKISNHKDSTFGRQRDNDSPTVFASSWCVSQVSIIYKWKIRYWLLSPLKTMHAISQKHCLSKHFFGNIDKNIEKDCSVCIIIKIDHQAEYWTLR